MFILRTHLWKEQCIRWVKTLPLPLQNQRTYADIHFKTENPSREDKATCTTSIAWTHQGCCMVFPGQHIPSLPQKKGKKGLQMWIRGRLFM
ncbi:hypothetical protein CIB84_013049 [Bambusicola thoracicus]|uniref:Uncharacterized protein n=1 Tax=Bambusicola thoracicus TaxID=9083 RepID=A0A2P4SGF2_BAMTH|nr:hypothetical protein CIB84_013049 [Bambusicola thoracicus]